MYINWEADSHGLYDSFATSPFGNCLLIIGSQFPKPELCDKLYTWTLRMDALASGIMYNCCIQEAM